MNKAGSLVSALATAFFLAALSPAPATAGLPQRNSSEADLARWDKELTLPPHVATRLDWARRSFVRSGYQKLERLARAKAPAIAAGKRKPAGSTRARTARPGR